MIDLFTNLIKKSSKDNFKTGDPSQHLIMLDNMINYLAPAIRAQNGYFIQKIQKKIIAENDSNGNIIEHNDYAHILLGEDEKNYKRVLLSTCLYYFDKDKMKIEFPVNQMPNYEHCDWLLCSNGSVWLIIDVHQLWNLTKDLQGDSWFHKLEQVLPKTYINIKFHNFCISPADLFDKGLVINFGYYDGNGRDYEGPDQNKQWGVHKLVYKDSFGKSLKTNKNPKSFGIFKLKPARVVSRYLLVRTEMSDSDQYREFYYYSSLKSIYNDLNLKGCKLQKYRAFTQTCSSDSENAKNLIVGQRPKFYELRKDLHYIVLSEKVGLETALLYAQKVDKKIKGKK